MPILPGSVHPGMASRSLMAWDAASAGLRGGDGGSALASVGVGTPLALVGFIRPPHGGVLTGAGVIMAGAVTQPGGPGVGPTPRVISIVAGVVQGQVEAVLTPLALDCQADMAPHITHVPGLSLPAKEDQSVMSIQTGTLPI